MPIPRVTSEIITSIYEQTMRKSHGTAYCMEVMKEMETENPELHEAIVRSVKAISTHMGLDLMNEKDYNNMLNMLNLATSVYQSIKQQMITNELEDIIA